MIGALPISSTIGRIFLYSGLKSCPQSEMQCASSTAKKDMRICLRMAMFSSFVRLSGATYSSLVTPEVRSSVTSAIWAFVNEELRKCAMPSFPATKPRMASTWFFINAISGEITMAVPSIRRAGSW